MASNDTQNVNFKLVLTYLFPKENDVFNFLTNMNKNNMSFPNEFTLKNLTNVNDNINKDMNKDNNKDINQNQSFQNLKYKI